MAEAVRERQKGSPGGTQSDPQKEQRKKTTLAALVMLVPFCAGMYLIFGSGGQDETPGAGNINLTVPDGRSAGIEASKQKAIENVRIQQRQQERSLAFDEEDFSLLADAPAKVRPSQEEALAHSQQAHRQATEMMQSFYERPKKDPEVERLQKKVEELSGQLQQTAATPDPLELAERQFQLAAKYLNPQGGTAERPARNTAPQDKGQAVPVRALGDGTVSSLTVPVADSLRPEGERNLGFITAVGSSQDKEHSSIRACVDEDQTLSGGDRVRLRLEEPVSVGDRTIRAGTVIYGVASIDGQRLGIEVGGIEDGGEIVPVSLKAYDLDGGEGLYVPDSKERTAAKEAAASIGTGLGTSISFARSAGQQVAMDLVRGAMTGGTQYAASRLREVRVTVKAGYRLLLISQK